MNDLTLSTGWTLHGLRAILIENRFLRLVVLPEAGAKIWQITYKPLDAPLLWNHPRVLPARNAIHARYDDVWSGGWDELFPNDESALINGEAYPDHGELWTSPWHAEPFASGDEVGVHLRLVTPISAIRVDKTIRLRRDSSRIAFRHTLSNPGFEPFTFLWKLHPAMAVTPQHRIDFPAMKVMLEPGFLGTLGGVQPLFDWPYAQAHGRIIDLRRVPPASAQQLYFFYGTQMQAGWCALTNTATRLACGLVFDQKVFPSCWLFASYGGWRNHNVAVLEPCTGYPVNFEAMRTAGRHRTLAPGETLQTDVLFVIQDGIQTVTRIEADGTIVGS